MNKFPSLLRWSGAAVLVILASATAACSGLGYQIVPIPVTADPSPGTTSAPPSVTATQTKIALRATGTPSVTSTSSPGPASSPSSVAATPTEIALPATSTPSAEPEAGPIAPDFTLSDLDGREVSLSDLRGQRVLLNFWATW